MLWLISVAWPYDSTRESAVARHLALRPPHQAIGGCSLTWSYVSFFKVELEQLGSNVVPSLAELDTVLVFFWGISKGSVRRIILCQRLPM